MPPAPAITRPCSAHATAPSVAVCGFCGTRLCATCFRFTVEGRAACTLCARAIATRRQRQFVVAGVLVAGAGLVAVAGYRSATSFSDESWLVFEIVLAFAIAAGFVGRRAGSFPDAREVTPRTPEPPTAAAAAATGTGAEPERAPALGRYAPLLEPEADAPIARRERLAAFARRAGAALVPSLSARAATGAALAVVAFVTLAVPAALHLPRWIEIEVLLGIVYVMLGGFLSVLLYRGYRFVDDHVFVAPAAPWETPEEALAAPTPSNPRWKLPDAITRNTGCDGCSGCSGVGDVGEGAGLVVGALVVAAAAAVAFFAAWLLVEVALPLVFLLAYRGLFRGVSLVAHDDHGCQGALGASLVWGYVAAGIAYFPLASITFILHRLLH